MSGAGKTVLLPLLEDMGYLCIDNIPPALFPSWARFVDKVGTHKPCGFVVISGAVTLWSSFLSLSGYLREMKVDYEIVFMDARTDETLIRRYKESQS